jgi:hypothetical protein
VKRKAFLAYLAVEMFFTVFSWGIWAMTGVRADELLLGAMVELVTGF